MFQCIGLGTTETGGCGEDWYHPGCLVGMGPRWFEKMKVENPKPLKTAAVQQTATDDDDEPPMPPGFPEEDDFEGFVCYKCVESNYWIKRYAGTSGFLPAVKLNHNEELEPQQEESNSGKRKAEDDAENQGEAKRIKHEEEPNKETKEMDEDGKELVDRPQDVASDCKLPNLPPPPKERVSLFFKEDFREKFCRCSSCYKHLNAHPQLLEEEETYEPPLSDDGASQHGGSTHGSGSLLERGESALRNVDRVRAIEGVMAYNHLKEQLKPFFQQFAESGQAIGAEDIKAYFAKLRGDEDDIKQAGEAAASSKDGGSGDSGNRQERSGY